MEYPVFLVVEATPDLNNIQVLQRYLDQSSALSLTYGAVPIAQYDVERALENAEAPAMLSVISFPDRKAIDALFSAPEYKKLLPLRQQGFSTIRYYICNEKIA